MYEIQNPILKGFHPDPSILRVEEDYYIATSTFEWFPGVQIYHSRDLKHYRLAAQPLSRSSQLDMAGNPSSGGVWAPCLSYSEGLFYLVYTNVRSFSGIFKDTHNYLVTTDNIEGEWSEPIYLNSSGFDPSLFHDSDGRKWLVNMRWDHRSGKNRFNGIFLQEYKPEEKQLTGPVYPIYQGTKLGLTEGPHLYKRNRWYFLITAEGGTSYEHAVTMARSRQLTGPYEEDPENPILTSWLHPGHPLQRAGHASLVETQTGEWYMAHLCSRPLPGTRRCVLGRETALQKMTWTSGDWLRLQQGGSLPYVEVEGPELSEHPFEQPTGRENFDGSKLSMVFQSLRIPLGEDLMSLTERPGWLRLKGRESLSSLHRQSFIARRQQSFCYTAETYMEFKPECFQQMAGLICWYDAMNFYYLHATWDEKLGRCVNILSCTNKGFNYPIEQGIGISSHGADGLWLKVRVFYDKLQFFYSQDGKIYTKIGFEMDAGILSDEQYWEIGEERFTGAFVGICCQDLSGRGFPADFDWFEYNEEDTDS